MTDKERLEEIKELHEQANQAYHEKDFERMEHFLETLFTEEFTDWLIEQAERLHGTKHKLGYIDMYVDCNRTVGNDSMKIHKLEQQNKRHREILKVLRGKAGDCLLTGKEMSPHFVDEFAKHALEESE